MRNALISLAVTAILAAAGPALANPYGDPYGPTRVAGTGDGAGLPGLPGGRAGRSGNEAARDAQRPTTLPPLEARTKRFCADFFRGRVPRGGPGLHPEACGDWFDQIARMWPAPRTVEGTAAGTLRGADGQPGPSIDGGQGGAPGAGGAGPGGGGGGGGGAGVSGGRGGAGGQGGSGF
jgi:hypothetical protein